MNWYILRNDFVQKISNILLHSHDFKYKGYFEIKKRNKKIVNIIATRENKFNFMSNNYSFCKL